LDLTRFGIEPNPGPVTFSNDGAVSISGKRVLIKKKVKAKARPVELNIPSFTNAPPISRPNLQPKGRRAQTMSGHSFNPRADMMAYMDTLSDAEKFPPVRLGGETMIQTALTTLHSVSSFNFSSFAANGSLIIHPRAWGNFLSSVTGSSPYTYTQFASFNASSLSTLQSLASSARVVSVKVKIYSTSSATNDAGALTVGLCPSDHGFLNNVEYSGSNAASTLNNVTSQSGYPVVAGATATQGFNEFSSEDWTDTVPLKGGASIFWLPEDPSSMIFKPDRLRQQLIQAIGGSSSPIGTQMNATEILDPFFCIGISGLTTGGSFNVEVFLNLEYTVTSGASNVIETVAGSMNSVQQFEVVKRAGANFQNLVVPDPEGSLWQKAKNLGSTIVKSGLNRASEFIFGSSDVGKAVSSFFS